MYRALLLMIAMASCLLGCQNDGPPPVTGDEEPAASASVEFQSEVITELTPQQELQKAVAIQAKDALFQKLSSRLMAALQADGPAEAINVCKAEAPAFAEQVKHDLGVNIGRTSFKLRNATNPPPDWADSLVEDRVAQPTFVSLADSKLGAFLPIMLQKKCELCHGPRDEIAQDVLAALETNYPNDQATGFREGDLRGWFWIEVPADVQPVEADSSEGSES